MKITITMDREYIASIIAERFGVEISDVSFKVKPIWIGQGYAEEKKYVPVAEMVFDTEKYAGRKDPSDIEANWNRLRKIIEAQKAAEE